MLPHLKEDARKRVFRSLKARVQVGASDYDTSGRLMLEGSTQVNRWFTSIGLASYG